MMMKNNIYSGMSNSAIAGLSGALNAIISMQ
jgi:hypothetical protein